MAHPDGGELFVLLLMVAGLDAIVAFVHYISSVEVGPQGALLDAPPVAHLRLAAPEM